MAADLSKKKVTQSESEVSMRPLAVVWGGICVLSSFMGARSLSSAPRSAGNRCVAEEWDIRSREWKVEDDRRFRADFWQKRPLVIRGLLRDRLPTLQAEQFWAAAREADTASRIAWRRKDGASERWSLERGPFSSKRASMDDIRADGPDVLRHWSLLLNDCERLFPVTNAFFFC
eukprot:scaffold1343_cov217-Pinguiococcus_pyrenoidosus.AAC.6